MKKNLSIIAAYSKGKRIIGWHGGIPWQIPLDMQQYRIITANGSMIMGRETYFSIPEKYRPLVDRENIVVSSKLNYADLSPKDSTIKIAHSVEEAVEMASRENVFFNGGQGIYEAGMKYATTIYATVVDYDGPGDRFFPEIGPEWNNVTGATKDDFVLGHNSTHPHQFITLRRTAA